jgi:hypothetical protein
MQNGDGHPGEHGREGQSREGIGSVREQPQHAGQGHIAEAAPSGNESSLDETPQDSDDLQYVLMEID